MDEEAKEKGRKNTWWENEKYNPQLLFGPNIIWRIIQLLKAYNTSSQARNQPAFLVLFPR